MGRSSAPPQRGGTMTADAVTATLAGLGSVRGWQEDFYRDLHRHPELSHQEQRTAADRGRAAAQAPATRCTRAWAAPAWSGVLRNGDGPTVLLRADMDALPVRETTGLPMPAPSPRRRRRRRGAGDARLRSRRPRHLPARRGPPCSPRRPAHWSGTVVAVFQPAEEVGDGARRHARRRAGRPGRRPGRGVVPARAAAARRERWAPGPARRCPPPTACGSPCTGAARTAPCRRPRWTRSCSRP